MKELNYKILKLDAEKSNYETISLSEVGKMDCEVLVIDPEVNPYLCHSSVLRFWESGITCYAIIDNNPILIEGKSDIIYMCEITKDMDIMVYKEGKRINHIYYAQVNNKWNFDGREYNHLNKVLRQFSNTCEFRVIKIK